MNNKHCADRLLLANTIISVAAITRIDYNPTERKLIVVLNGGSVVHLKGDLAESAWDYLRSQICGCIEPLSKWENANMKLKSSLKHN